ncbi:adenylosuccinate lyase [Clohesyomyces aquaticus]|uniref:Adenylosuccinate lyase n=1 Tax=Clohesyomyces aquaticus TaxID=1231657 RepID=A0A1Y1Z5Z3_9PLEO|nr:adenylosuccinate lyase [Clohesyomyces aquaticus]
MFMLRIASRRMARNNVATFQPRRSMGSVSAIDSAIFRTLFGTEEIRKVFDDKAYLKRCVDAETALARAQSKCNVIPSHIGEVVTSKSNSAELDFDRLRFETEIVGYPILPLVRQLSASCGDEAGRYVHWGATTQDIMDLASMLQMKQGLEIVERTLRSVITNLEYLSKKHRDTPMAGRTHLQHALPITFGHKCAIWLSGFQRHLERLEQLKPRALMVQFGGAAGSLASLGSGDDGIRVRKEMAKDLGLSDPPITWHVARDGVAEIANYLALVGGSLGKLALDIIIMSSNELSEVSEPFVPHRGASSTMPQKRNPISSEVILAASKILRSNAGLVLDGMVSDFERASGPWHLEWVAIPESFVIAVGALNQADFALSGLVVNPQKMLDNLYSTRGLIAAEAVMMGLAPHVGRQKAHDIVYEACRESIESDTSLLEALLSRSEITGKISKETLSSLCDAKNYLGSCGLMVDEVLAASK